AGRMIQASCGRSSSRTKKLLPNTPLPREWTGPGSPATRSPRAAPWAGRAPRAGERKLTTCSPPPAVKVFFVRIVNLNPDTAIGASAWFVDLEGHRLLMDAGTHPKCEGREGL